MAVQFNKLKQGRAYIPEVPSPGRSRGPLNCELLTLALIFSSSNGVLARGASVLASIRVPVSLRGAGTTSFSPSYHCER